MSQHQRTFLCLVLVFGAQLGIAAAQTPSNLLALATVDTETTGAPVDVAEQVERLTDGDPGTTAVFVTSDGEPLDILFALENETVAPEALEVTLSADSEVQPPARVDLLASTVSASSGFASLRTEQIDPLKPEQTTRFASAAANWLLVRLYPATGTDMIAVAEISVSGKIGLPETIYAFGETPAQALEIVGAMQGIGAADLSLTPTEREIFALAANGSLNNADFVSIALLASGVTDPVVRSDYRARVDALATAAREVLDMSAPPAESGAELLRWLHDRALTGGYEEGQTNLSEVLDSGVFNCVSSAVLYNAVAGQLGFDVRAIEVPDHAFSIVYDGLDHMDVETTTPDGFNPRRDRVAEFEALTGFRYIPQSNKFKRREIDAAGLASLIYYNHGVTHLREGRYPEALFANFRAMSLDPDFASAATNALAALGRWSSTLADEGNWIDATDVAAVGVRLAPDDRGLRATQKAIWQKWAFSEADAGRATEALAVLNAALRETGDDGFVGMRSAVLTRPAEALIRAGNWQVALDQTTAADGILDSNARADLDDWRSTVFRRWANILLDERQFPQALDVLSRGIETYPDDRRLDRSVRYLAQEWARGSVAYRDGLNALRTVTSAVPSVHGLDDVTEAFVRRHVRSGLESVSLDSALADAAEASPLIGPELAADLGAHVYEAYGHAEIDAQDWARAAEIYALGRQAYPDGSLLARNARYVAQEWQRAANREGGVAALEDVQTALKALFPEFAVDPGFGEDEIVRQINAAVRSGDYVAATAALTRAQLLIRPETYQDLSALIFDRQAQVAMKAGDWPRAAAIYFDARTQLGVPRLFSNNVAHIAQEWTRAAAAEAGAAGVAMAMGDLRKLFPDDEEVAGMGFQTLRRIVADLVAQDAFGKAEQTIRDAQSFLSKDQTSELIITLYSRSASKAIDSSDWPSALGAYVDGLAIVPDSRGLSRNIPYVFQEWSRQALRDGGSERLVSEIDEMRSVFPESKSLPEVLENVLGGEVTDRIGQGNPHAALDLIATMQDSLGDEVTDNLKVLAYDQWAKTKMDAGAWQDAITIYDQGLLEVPDSRVLDNNRGYAESKL